MKVLLATTNAGKVREVRKLLPEVDWVGLEDLPGPIPPAVEDGETFEENARAKARHYHELSGLATVAEDSGLSVDALDGRPGVRSARYGGDIPDPARCQLLLEELAGIAKENRGAAFVSCAVLMAGGKEIACVRGEVRGRISMEARGTGGFGYDPVFFYPAYGRTLGEVSPEEKNAVSHRGAAMHRLQPHLKALG